MNLSEILQGVNVALVVIQQRLVLLLCMLCTMALFCWAMWQQTTLGAIIAATWGLTIFLPVLFTGRGHHGVPEAPQHSDAEARPT